MDAGGAGGNRFQFAFSSTMIKLPVE